ncbi:MAG: hypothetical protein ACK5TK_00690 [Betaproteobacteria bacterium]
MKSRYDFLARREDRRNLALVRVGGVVAVLALIVGLGTFSRSHPPTVAAGPSTADAPQPPPPIKPATL